MKCARYLGGQTLEPQDSNLEARRPPRPQDRKTDSRESVHEEFEDDHTVNYRDVTIIDASAPKQLSISVQTPVEDMAAMGKPVEQPSGPASQGRSRNRSGARFIRGSSS
jgi:Lhr-like helicase